MSELITSSRESNKEIVSGASSCSVVNADHTLGLRQGASVFFSNHAAHVSILSAGVSAQSNHIMCISCFLRGACYEPQLKLRLSTRHSIHIRFTSGVCPHPLQLHPLLLLHPLALEPPSYIPGFLRPLVFPQIPSGPPQGLRGLRPEPLQGPHLELPDCPRTP